MTVRALREWQLDGLPGPTLIHGGLSIGNLASQQHARQPSSPRAGALACLRKMRTVLDLGVAQAFLPPLLRPDQEFLARCGYTCAHAPELLLAMAASTAFQWTANLGTAAPACDTDDGYDRLVIANLAAMAHRSIEAPARLAQARAWLHSDVVTAVPNHASLGDEGAANHTRIVGPNGVCHLFVYGSDGTETLPGRFPARQTLLASRAVARLLRLPDHRCLFVRQHPDAIAAGAFHNDVVMVGNGDRLLLHRRAWVDQDAALSELQRRCGTLHIAQIDDGELPLDAAVRCYLFNAQLLDTPDGWKLVAPEECIDVAVQRVLQRLVDDGLIASWVLVGVRESMRGGGGPACLRLRLPSAEIPVHAGLQLNHQRLDLLERWVTAHYRERLVLDDLRDPALAHEARAAETTLLSLLRLPLLELPSCLP